MSRPAAGARAPLAGETMRLRVVVGPLLAPTLCRMVSIALARAQWPVDRLDDALLVCDALCAHAPSYVGASQCLTFSMRADARTAELRVHELAPGAAAELVRDAALPIVGNVLERLADRVRVEGDANGADSELVVALSSS